MNQLARHFWFTISALLVKLPLHSNEVYSAPVRAYAPLPKTILPALGTDTRLQQTAVDFFPNYPDFASVDGAQHKMSILWNLEPHSLFKRSINWNGVIPNRPALAEIVVVGSIAIILALLSGMVLWFFILKWTKEEKTMAFGFNILSKQIPFGNLARGGEAWSQREECRGWQSRTGKLKKIDFSALKLKRKKKKVSKEANDKQSEKEKPLEEGKEKGGKKSQVAKRQETQKKLRKIKTIKSKLKRKLPKGKKLLTQKKLK
ncbi:uncharacterized protein LOC112544536 [Pelodiscus sinensis]|uniref:uncharacterized protein LOC112544536 n=1 Tax=Pelodiscus sinensis TaxID=13735 RepID=UPI003F6D0D25